MTEVQKLLRRLDRYVDSHPEDLDFGSILRLTDTPESEKIYSMVDGNGFLYKFALSKHSGLFEPYNHLSIWADTSLMADDRAIALLGYYGAGKSTLTENLGRMMTRDETLVVFVKRRPFLIGYFDDERRAIEISAAYGIIPTVNSSEPEIRPSPTQIQLDDVNPEYVEDQGFDQKVLTQLSDALGMLQENGLPSYFLFNPEDKIRDSVNKLQNHFSQKSKI
jgi:hypothetical protein